MINSAVGKALFLSLAMLIVSGTTSCFKGDFDSSDENPRVGGIGLKLSVTPGVTVSSVNYTISGNGFSKTGSIDVTGGGSTFTKQIDGIPPGNGYKIALTAQASDGSTGSGSATFNVVARQVTSVSVVLRFIPSAPATGSVLVNGSVNVCPLVSAITAQPPSVAVGSTTAITSSASDSDSQPSPLKYKWTISPASAGSLSSATVANPTFTAGAAGTAKLTLTVSDGDDPCETDPNSLNALSIDVVVTSGSGAAGSSSGPAGTGGAVAGSGAGGAGTGGAGTGGASTGGAGTGGAGTGGAGTGGTGGAATSGTGGAATAGAGGTATAGAGGAGTGGAGGGIAGSGTSNSCTTCESTAHPDPNDASAAPNTSCPDSRAAGLALTGNTAVLPGIAESTGQSKAIAFQQILDCFHSTHCAKTADTDCFCGAGVDVNDCFVNGTFASATGVCKNIVAVGAESTAIGDINNRFFDPLTTIGAATTVIETCDVFSCVNECL